MIAKKYQVEIKKYNQKGDGIAFIDNKPVYVFGAIRGEILLIIITNDCKNYLIGKIVSILKRSKNRTNLKIVDQEKIGGYELIHMNDVEQLYFKLEKLKEVYLQIAKIKLENIESFFGQKRFYYRNKIIIHNGFFYQKNSHLPIIIKDFKLTSIKTKTKLKGEVIIRELDQRIEGHKNDNLFNYHSVLNYNFRINLNSFYQINNEVALQIYQDILAAIIIDGISFDLYSGIGIIAIIIAKCSKKVIAVENNKWAAKDAYYNIAKNKIKNIEYFKSDVDKFLEKCNYRIDSLIVDPPRSGLNKKVVKLILTKLKPQKIIYLSCNPATQARDFLALSSNYKIVKIKLYDMFAQTYHCESLLILKRI